MRVLREKTQKTQKYNQQNNYGMLESNPSSESTGTM